MSKVIEEFADYIIEWLISKDDLEFDRQTEYQIIRMICDCVDLYGAEEKELKEKMKGG